MFADRTILITGGTGSWGHELVRQLLTHDPKEIRIFSRNESLQFTMKQEFDHHPKLRFIIGDVKKRGELIRASAGVHYIFHLAALKHVPVCEEQPMEALKTNVLGTQNVINAAIACKVDKVVYVSTDKASDPSNFYGLSKAMGEKLIIHANTRRSKTRFVCIRGGNVLGTNGSVIQVFKKQLEEKREIGITDMAMTRFFLTVEEAIKLLFRATVDSVGGEIFVLRMPSIRIADLAAAIIEASGYQDVKVITVGVRPGEKIHELLLSSQESKTSVVYDNDYYVILPTIQIDGVKEHYASCEPVRFKKYNSSAGLLDKDGIRDILKKGGFLA